MNLSERNDYSKMFSAFLTSRERSILPKLKKIIDGQIQTYNVGDMLPLEPMYSLFKNLYIDAAKVWGNKTRLQVIAQKRYPIGFSEEMQKLMDEYFGTYLFDDIQDINETTAKDLQKVFAEAYAQGISINAIRDQVMQSGYSAMRSRRIARTETTTAANRGAMIAAEATKLPLKKIWIATKDNRTRDSHRHMDGVTVPYGQYFDVNGVKMSVPGERINEENKVPASEVVNCRCCVAFEVVKG